MSLMGGDTIFFRYLLGIAFILFFWIVMRLLGFLQSELAKC
jgi:hypothetical protein